MGLELLKYLPI